MTTNVHVQQLDLPSEDYGLDLIEERKKRRISFADISNNAVIDKAQDGNSTGDKLKAQSEINSDENMNKLLAQKTLL